MTMPKTTHECLQALNDPNCPTEGWWELALQLPYFAMKSPLFDLLTLENPARWSRSVDHRLWLWRHLEYLSAIAQMHLAADCLDHAIVVLHDDVSVEYEFKQYAAGFARMIRENHEETALVRSMEQHPLLDIRGPYENLCATVRNAISYFRQLSPGQAIGAAAEIISMRRFYRDFGVGTADPEAYMTTWREELTWQWTRMVYYLDQQYPPVLPIPDQYDR